MSISSDNYCKKGNEKMAETVRNIPPKYRARDPISPLPIQDNPLYIPTSRDYGINKVTKETQIRRFPKSNKFSSSLVGRNYSNSSLNTSIDKQSYRYSNSLSF